MPFHNASAQLRYTYTRGVSCAGLSARRIRVTLVGDAAVQGEGSL
jgi:hypothetical protein